MPGKRPSSIATMDTWQPWQTGCDLINHSFTQSAFFYAVDTVIEERMKLNFEVVINSVPLRPKTHCLARIS